MYNLKEFIEQFPGVNSPDGYWMDSERNLYAISDMDYDFKNNVLRALETYMMSNGAQQIKGLEEKNTAINLVNKKIKQITEAI